MVAFRAKQLLYQTILTTTSLLFWTGCSGSRAALSVVRAVSAFLLLGVVCVALDLLLGVVGRQMSLSLRAGRAALTEDMGMTLLPRTHPIMALCCWRCALSCAMSEDVS